MHIPTMASNNVDAHPLRYERPRPSRTDVRPRLLNVNGPARTLPLAPRFDKLIQLFFQLSDGRALKRPLARALVVSAGMKTAVDITHAVDYLVTADVGSSSKKARHARSKGVTIIDEIDFWQMLDVATVPRHR